MGTHTRSLQYRPRLFSRFHSLLNNKRSTTLQPPNFTTPFVTHPNPDKSVKMKFTAAVVLAAATAVSAGKMGHGYGHEKNVTYTTEVVTEYTTYCPEPTTLTWGDKTITVTEPTTVTITDCPHGCTITKPVYSTSKVYCHDCGHNATATYKPTGYTPEEPKPTKPPVVEAGAAKAAGAGLAALVGLVAFAL